jgi:hypothetical protein
MSDLPRDALGYQAVVTEYFLGLRGAGLLVSPLDEELVADWERRGLPVAVVCRGLRRGIEDALARGVRPRSVRALRLAVEDEWRAYQLGRVGDAPPPPPVEDDAAGARLRAARALLAEAGRTAPAALVEGYRAAWAALAGPAPGAASPLEGVEAALARADALLLRAWVSALSRARKRDLGAELRRLSGPRPRGTSRRAHRDLLRAHLADAARRAGLTTLRGSV